MNWTFFINKKLTASALLFAVIGVIVLTNIHENRQTGRMNAAISSIYQDRMLAESYIFLYADHLQNIGSLAANTALADPARTESIQKEMLAIVDLNKAYSATYLTKEEATHFKQLGRHFTSIAANTQTGNFNQVRVEADDAQDDLHHLSAIQVSEAEELMQEIRSASASMSVGTRFEIVVLIIIGLIIQALIFASKSISSKTFPQQPHLN